MTATPQLNPAGGSSAWVKVTKDKSGKVLNPPLPFAIPAFIGIDDLSDKTESKPVHGSKEMSIAVISGARKINFSFTIDSYTGGLLNNLYYGEEAQNKQQVALPCVTPYIIPEVLLNAAKVRQQKLVHLGRFDSGTSVKIADSAAIKITTGIPVAGRYLLDDDSATYTFSVADVGKTFEITLDSNGTPLVITGKITNALTFNPLLVSSKNYIVKTGATSLTDGTAMTVAPYKPGSAIGDVGVVQASYEGILAFNATQTTGGSGKNITVKYYCDSRAVTAVIAALPAAAYALYIESPGDSLYFADSGVYLTANAGTAMTGVVVDEAMTIINTGTPTSGQVLSDGKGYFVFAAADAGDSVRIEFVADYMSLKIDVPEGATFLENLAVRTEGGGNFVPVARTKPLAIDTDQYCHDGGLTYYFDATNAGQHVYIDCLVEKEGGNLVELKNRTKGGSPVFQLVLHNEIDGDALTIVYPTCKCLGIGIPLKQDPSAMKFDIEIYADRTTNSIGRISTST